MRLIAIHSVKTLIVMAGLIVAVVAAESDAAVETLFISGYCYGNDSGSGSYSYIGVDDSWSTIGIELDLPQPAAISRVGGMFRGGSSTPATLFGTVTSLNGNIPNLSEVQGMNVGLFDVHAINMSVPSLPYYATATRVLDTGNYAVVFGNNRFGASGEAVAPTDFDLINPYVTQYPFSVNSDLTYRVNQYGAFAAGVLGSWLAPPSDGITLLGPEDFTTAEVIAFETGSTELPDVDQVRFLDWRDPGNYSCYAGFDSSQFGSQAMCNLSSVEYTDLGIEFLTPARSVGFWVNQGDLSPVVPGADTITFRALDSSGGLLYETDIDIPVYNETPLLDEGLMFVGLSSETPIGRVEWLSNNEGFFFVDNVSFTHVPQSIPGDTDNDCDVDNADALILAGNWLQSVAGGASDGDFNNDGYVNALDATIMAANWKVGTAATVPEPTMITLILGTVLILGMFGDKGRWG